MTLTFRLLDTWASECEYQNTGTYPPPRARIVTLALTPEQAAQVAPRKVGSARDGQPVYETIASVDVDAEVEP